MASVDFGLNVAAYFRAELGLGEVARQYVTALQHLNVPLALQDASCLTSQRKESGAGLQFSLEHPYPANLICINAPEVQQFIKHFGASYLQTKYNIGSWWWEIEELPQSWKQEFFRFDELWVGTEFIRQNFVANAAPIPVITMPPLVVLNHNITSSKADYRLRDDEFVFLFVFDFFSCFERKNPLAVVAAFKTAFSKGEKVRLVIKSTNGESFPNQWQALKQACDHGQITLIDQYMSKPEVIGLIAASDCYVSLHKSEGFGLPLAEAMLLKKPVIATGWSGNMDFTHADNSFIVQHGLSTNSEDYGPYKRGIRWAEPDLEHAARLMKVIFEDHALARVIGERGAEIIEEKYGLQAVSSAIVQRLVAIKPKVLRVQQIARFKTAMETGVEISPANVERAAMRGGKTERIVDWLESKLAALWHRRILGWPLRFISACSERFLRHGASDLRSSIRRAAIDDTFEAIAKLAKEDAEQIAQLNAKLSALETSRERQSSRQEGVR